MKPGGFEPGHEESRVALLVDPPPGALPALAHLLRCEICQGHLRSALRKQWWEPRADSGWLDRAWQAMVPELEERLQRTREAHSLLAEMMAAPVGARAALLTDPRAAAGDFGELVLLRAREEAPGEALHLAGLVSRWIDGHSLNEEEAEELRSEADVVEGDAWRRLGDYGRAMKAFRKATSRATSTDWASFAFSRWEGVMWWQLGHFERAEALLRHSVWRLGEVAPPEEEAAGRVLLGLLLLERGQEGRALPLLRAGRAALDAEEWPWLALQARAALARQEGAVGAVDRGRCILSNGLTRSEEALREDPRAQWLEAGARLVLGELEPGERLLETARVRLLAERRAAPAALCSLDLAAHLCGLGRIEEAGALLDDFEGTFPDERAAAECLRQVGQAPSLAQTSGNLGRRLRRVLRREGHDVLLPITGRERRR